MRLISSDRHRTSPAGTGDIAPQLGSVREELSEDRRCPLCDGLDELVRHRETPAVRAMGSEPGRARLAAMCRSDAWLIIEARLRAIQAWARRPGRPRQHLAGGGCAPPPARHPWEPRGSPVEPRVWATPLVPARHRALRPHPPSRVSSRPSVRLAAWALRRLPPLRNHSSGARFRDGIARGRSGCITARCASAVVRQSSLASSSGTQAAVASWARRSTPDC